MGNNINQNIMITNAVANLVAQNQAAETLKEENKVQDQKLTPPKKNNTNGTQDSELATKAEFIAQRIMSTIGGVGLPIAANLVEKLFYNGCEAAKETLTQQEKQLVETAPGASKSSWRTVTTQIATSEIISEVRGFTREEKERLGMTDEVERTAEKLLQLIGDGILTA